MSLLDRLRGQPSWQHDDPDIRASAVDDLENDAQDLLTAIATEDTDAGVRLAAVSRLVDPVVIARVATHDAADEVRREASAMLRAIAIDANDDETAGAALSGLTEARDLGEVARVAKLESVSQSALERLQSAKAIGAVARRATHRLVRDAALARLDDRDELLAVAVKSDHREVALAAFERLAANGANDRDMLKTIVVRARTKPVSRRARLALNALEAQPVVPTPVELRDRRDALCDRVNELLGW
ncbi:MAG: hypothetical protein VYE68_10270 [Acidobacteriota bacterium]|nr:hypothetical protein [Acidobacteriota bacterium]